MKYQARRRANLSGRMLRGEDLREVNWRNAKLVGADLSGALLYGADLSNTDLTGGGVEQPRAPGHGGARRRPRPGVCRLPTDSWSRPVGLKAAP